MDLAASTLPAITGTATFSGVRNTTFPLTLDTSTALSLTGIFTYSAIRPKLTGVVSQRVNASTTSSAPSTPSTRQILIP